MSAVSADVAAVMPNIVAVDRHFVQARYHCAPEGDEERPFGIRRCHHTKRLDGDRCEQHPRRAAGNGQDSTLGQQLSDDASPSSSEGHPDGDLGLTTQAPGQQQPCDIGAHDQEQDADRDAQRAQRWSRCSNGLLLDALDVEAMHPLGEWPSERPGRRTGTQPLADDVRLVGRRFDRHPAASRPITSPEPGHRRTGESSAIGAQ